MDSSVETKLKSIPDKYLIIIAQLLAGHINDSKTFDMNQPILKPSIKNIYWLFIIQYAVLAVLGIITNFAIIIYTMYHKIYKDTTHAFIVNLALCHFIQCAIVLPITLTVMLLQNWIFGQFLCFFLPILQDIPLHVALISHLLIAWDRSRWIEDPLRSRLPAFVCCCATWLTGMVIALPYPIYTIYLELGDYLPRLHGVGLCIVNLVDDMHEYMKGLFIIMYCGPTILLSYLYIRTAREFHIPDDFENSGNSINQQRNSSISSINRSSRRSFGNRSCDIYNTEFNTAHEKRTQRYFGFMAATQVLCICPLMILRLAKMVLTETYENSSHFDFTYLMFVWIAFLPTVIFPCIYALEILPRTEKQRIRGYFRLSSKRFKMQRNSRKEFDEHPNTKNNLKNDNWNVKTNMSETRVENANNNRQIYPPTLIKLSGSINNSCSNITSSTYCNNETEHESVDLESNESVDSNIVVQYFDFSPFTRNNSCNRNIRTIDSLENKRIVENAKTSEVEIRKLSVTENLDESTKFKNASSSFKSVPYIKYHKRRNRKSFHDSPRRLKRNNFNLTKNDEIIGIGIGADIGAGVFGDREFTNKINLTENRMRRPLENRISSTRSSIKSEEYTSSRTDLDFRENIFADL